jgi:cytochrome c-type biogenesis protein CcmH/NrfF
MIVSVNVILWVLGVILTLLGAYVVLLLRGIDKSLEIRDARIASTQRELTEHKNYCGKKFQYYDEK